MLKKCLVAQNGSYDTIHTFCRFKGLDQSAYWTSGQWGGTGYVWTGSGAPLTAK